jgi:hypothetical protein
MRFRPRRWPGVLIGAGLFLLLLAGETWLVSRIVQRTPDLTSLLLGLLGLLPLAGLAAVGYGLYGLLNLVYEMNRNRLLIRWAASEQVIPLHHITCVIDGSQVAGVVRWRGMRLPGYVIGRGRAREGRVGPFLSLATEPLARQILLVTPTLSYAISPADREGFLAALAIRQQMGALQQVAQEERHPRLITWMVGRGRALRWPVLAGILANGALFAYLCWRYSSAPLFLPLHFDAAGRGDRIGPRSELFRLPLIGLLALVVDSALGAALHPRFRVASYILVWGAFLIQGLLGIALWRLT